MAAGLPPGTASGYRESNSTADRALTILGMFSETRLTLTAAEVGDTLGVARSTAYRYLQSLVRSMFLEESPQGGFRLGLRVLELGRLARRAYGLSEAALPLMRDLADRFHQTVLLTRRSGDAIVCVEREEWTGQYVRLSYERGTLLPINAGASAIVLLAWLPEVQVRELLSRRPLQRFTENTVTDIDELIGRLAVIKHQGYAITHAQVDPDAMGIAAPVFGPSGDVVAAISVVAMHRRLPELAQPDVIDALCAAAAQMTATLDLVS